ncbi:MAG: hypothetical protein WCQ54_03170 [Clostridiaceae bacterium]
MLSYVDLVEKIQVNNYQLPDNEYFKNEKNYGNLERGNFWQFRNAAAVSQNFINYIKKNN